MSGLPSGWVVTIFDDVISSMTNGLNGTQNKDGIGIPVSRIETISHQFIDFNKIGYISDYDASKIENFKLNENDILFSHINSPIHLGKTAIYNSERELYHGVNLLRISLNEAVDPRLFNYYCKYVRALGVFSSQAQHAVNQSSLNQKKLGKFEIVLPPKNEQIRISDKLDSILAKVDQAQARLEKIPHILKRFRQSVLAAATSGELTREWREENGLSYEWQSIKVSTLVSKIEAGKNIKCDERPPHDNEFGIIKISAVTWGFYDEAQSKTLKDDKLFIENRRVGVGDFLISRANTLELLGMPVIVKKVTKNLMLSDKVLRLVMPEQEKAWLDIFLRSPKGRLEIQSRATGNQESMRNIGQKALFDIDVLLPTSIEKTEIVKIVGLLTSHVEMLEKQYFIIKSRLDKLAQSILAKAFRGELVEQDSNDESASQLLERIKSQQLEEPKPAKRTRSTKDTAAQKVEEVSSTEASEESIQLQSEVLSILQKANIELSAQQLMDKLTEQSFEQVDALFTELKRLLDAAVITKDGIGESCTFKAIKK